MKVDLKTTAGVGAVLDYVLAIREEAFLLMGPGGQSDQGLLLHVGEAADVLGFRLSLLKALAGS